MSNLRTTQILRNKEWVEVPFMEIKAGDTFRLLEPDGTPVSAFYKTEFVATSDAYLNEEGIGAVNTEDKNYEKPN